MPALQAPHHEGLHQAASAAMCALTILSGFCTGSPRLILLTFSLPSVTLPPTVDLFLRSGRARHRGRAAHMRLLVELGLELLAGTAGAGALRTSRLRHEAVDHAMEHD